LKSKLCLKGNLSSFAANLMQNFKPHCQWWDLQVDLSQVLLKQHLWNLIAHLSPISWSSSRILADQASEGDHLTSGLHCLFKFSLDGNSSPLPCFLSKDFCLYFPYIYESYPLSLSCVTKPTQIFLNLLFPIKNFMSSVINSKSLLANNKKQIKIRWNVSHFLHTETYIKNSFNNIKSFFRSVPAYVLPSKPNTFVLEEIPSIGQCKINFFVWIFLWKIQGAVILLSNSLGGQLTTWKLILNEYFRSRQRIALLEWICIIF